MSQRWEAALFARILAGTDGSDTARLAIAHAADLARRLSAQLTVAAVYTGQTSRSWTVGTPLAEPNARALLRDVEAEYRGSVKVATRAVQGEPATALVDLVAADGFDLLVVGNKGMARTSWAPQRSIPGRVSHRSPAAVLVVDTVRGRPPGYGRILVGTDGSPTSVRAVEVAVRLGEVSNALVTAAAAASSDPVGQAALAPLRSRWPGLDTRVLRGSPADAICTAADADGYDLLVVGNRGMAGARRLLGSTPDRVVHRARTSVLIVHTSD